MRQVAPGAKIRRRQVAPGARIRGCGRAPRFVWRAAPPHGEWPSAHLICNNSKTIRDTMLGIFVKGPWYSTFIPAKYEYSTQNIFSVKPKFAEKCGQLPRSTLYTKQLMIAVMGI